MNVKTTSLSETNRMGLCSRWLGTLTAMGLALLLGPAVSQAQRNAVIHPLTVPAKAGRVVARVNVPSRLLPWLREVVGASPDKDTLDANLDARANFGWFCAPTQDLFDVLVQESRLTPHDQWCWKVRFPPGTPQPEAFLVGHLRVVLVAHRDNPVEAMTLAGLRKALSEPCKSLSWSQIDGAGTHKIEVFGPPENSWARKLVRDKCLSRWHDAEQPGVREFQRLGFRDDMTACEDAREVLAKVRAHRYALGWFACTAPLDPQVLHGVKPLRIAADRLDAAVSPPLADSGDPAYPLAEPLVLYVHPKAPPKAWEFARFAQSEEAAKIAQRHGIWPDWLHRDAQRQERLALVKAGKGTPITVYSLMGRKAMLQDLATKFVEDKAAIQMKVEKKGNWDKAFARYAQGEIDFFLTDETATEDEMTPKDAKASSKEDDAKKDGNAKAGNPQKAKSTPTRVELGQMAVGVIVHPENLLDSLPLDELQGIFSGEIKAWPGMKDLVAKMHLVGLDPQSPLTLLFKEKLAVASPSTAASGDTSPGRSATDFSLAKYTAKPDTEQVILTVARDPSAIGFVDLSRLPKDEKSVKLIPVFVRKGKAPAPKEIQNPLTRTLLLYASPRASQTAKDFATFVTSADCAEVLAQHGLVSPARKAEMAKRKPELPNLKEFAERNQPAKEAGSKGNAVAAVPALNLPDPDQDDAKAKTKPAQNTNPPVALPDLAPPAAEPWRTALEGTPTANPSAPPFGAPHRPADAPTKSSHSSTRELAKPSFLSGVPSTVLFAITAAAGLVVVVFAWRNLSERKRKKR